MRTVPAKHSVAKPCCTMVKVRVSAGARHEKVERTARGFRIDVREPAADNRANVRVRELLAIEYGVPERAVRLVSGHHAPSKTFTIQI